MDEEIFFYSFIDIIERFGWMKLALKLFRFYKKFVTTLLELTQSSQKNVQTCPKQVRFGTKNEN